ncbi:MAG: acyl-CoA dehydrogenase [Alphaproteobacteria bacterium]
MTEYNAPIADMRFILAELIGLKRLNDLPGMDEVSDDLVDQVLEAAGVLAKDLLAPLNWSGDQQGATFHEDGSVTTAEGFKDAYREYAEGGWNSLPFDPEYGGQGLPWALSFPVQEMLQASNMSFSLCPMLNQGAVDALTHHGSDELKAIYLEKLIEGTWTGTMNLTEPQAGSDLARIRTKAEPAEDGSYKISGQKIYITYGEHDFTDNIVHLVLARLPDALEGVKGISLFVVPKFIPDADGNPGERNDVKCISIEHKLGIHASPTCTMSFGEEGGATGWLVGEENGGLIAMFTMMNNARLGVGVQGMAVADRAYQAAVHYARDRVQSAHVTNPRGDGVEMIRHADIRRMLMTMRSQVEACRALAYEAGFFLDLARLEPDEGKRAEAQARVDLLTPIVKAWGTDIGVDVASMGVQIHGGMGFVEETGAAQYYRDARIAPIYEGTNGIQANDLAFRKLLRDRGTAARALIAEMKDLDREMSQAESAELISIREHFSDSLSRLTLATDWMLEQGHEDIELVAASANDYLTLFGMTAGGWMMARAAMAADAQLHGLMEHDEGFLRGKLHTAQFYANHILPRARALSVTITRGARATLELDEALF